MSQESPNHKKSKLLIFILIAIVIVVLFLWWLFNDGGEVGFNANTSEAEITNARVPQLEIIEGRSTN